MPDKKITELDPSNLPLSGAEEMAIVQGGVTKKANVVDLYSNFYATLNLKEDKSNKGVADGYVPLNSINKIDSSFFPSSLGSQNLQQVTDVGNITTNNITVGGIVATNLPNANGDVFYSQNIVVKADGTIGKENKPLNEVTLTQVENQYFASNPPAQKLNLIVFDESSKSLTFSDGTDWIDIGVVRPLIISSTINVVADLYYNNFWVSNPITITINGAFDGTYFRNRRGKYFFTNTSNGIVTIIPSVNSGFYPLQASVIIPIGETRVFTRTDDGQAFFVSKA